MDKNLRIICESKLWDPSYYKTKYSLIYMSDIEAAEHYLTKGYRQGYDPSAHFSTVEYFFYNPKVQIKMVNPLLHYETKQGARKGVATKFFNGIVPGFNCLDCEMANSQLEIEVPVSMLQTRILGPGKSRIGMLTRIGKSCTLRSVHSIGRMTSIAENCVFWNANHPVSTISTHVHFLGGTKRWTEGFVNKEKNYEQFIRNRESVKASYENETKRNAKLIIGNDVWIGNGAKILQGVQIGDGAIIGAGSIVTKDVLPYSIVAGNPAKLIRMRFSDKIIEELMNIQWWEYGPDILNDVNYSNVEESIKVMKERIEQGFLKYESPKYLIDSATETYSKCK